jgi:hypothetical protein
MAVKFIASIQRYTGLAADSMPTGVPVGSTFFEYDTGVSYITYDGTNWAVYDAYDQEEKAVNTSAAVMTNALTVFTIAGGPIEIQNLLAVCITNNNVTGSTLQFSTDPTAGAATTISAASASLTNATAGTIVNITGTLANAAVITVNGTAISQAGQIVVPVGIMTLVVGVGSTTGTWTINMRYKPLARGVTVTAAY